MSDTLGRRDGFLPIAFVDDNGLSFSAKGSGVKAIKTIDYSHHEIHSGSSFTCHYSQTAPTNIGEMTIIAFFTSNTTKWIHLFASASSTAASTFAVYEDSALDVGEGSDLVVYNRNRNSATASTVLTVTDPKVAGKVTSFSVVQAATANLVTTKPIYLRYLGAAAAGADTAGEQRDVNEFVLKQNTQYAFVVTNTTDDTNTHNIMLDWYEHTDA